jgi:DNA-binding response OmpR family regulator
MVMDTNKKIVVVEDDADLLFLLGKVLKKAGYHVEGFLNGSTIVSNKNYPWPDLFILDKEMEFMDGLEISNYLKSNKQTEAIPVVMMSGAKENENAALQAGADYFLEKPLNIKRVLKIIHSLIFDQEEKRSV